MRRKLQALAAAVCAALILTGCASLLERSYAVSDLHTSKFWESEAADTLRAENRQDIVNDLLLLISQHTEDATLRLYNFTDDVTVSETVQSAITEVRRETPMGAYAVEYITASNHPQRSYYEIDLIISYRRTAEQAKSIVSATSAEAVYRLLEDALAAEKTELVVRIGYWDEGSRDAVETAMAELRAEKGIEGAPYWSVAYYPEEGTVGLVEFQLDAPAPEEPEMAPETDAEGGEGADAAEEAAAGKDAPDKAPDGAAAENGTQSGGETEAPQENDRKKAANEKSQKNG